MNKNLLLDIPKLSSIAIHRARSLFDIEQLLSLQRKALPKQIVVRTHSITRWNE